MSLGNNGLKFILVALRRFEGLEIEATPDTAVQIQEALDEAPGKGHSLARDDAPALRFIQNDTMFSLDDVMVSATVVARQVSRISDMEARSLAQAPACYIILATPRSGSDMLCTMIQKSQGAGWPLEHLNQIAVSLLVTRKISLKAWLSEFTRNSIAHHGENFGTKMATDDLADIVSAVSLDDAAYLHDFILHSRVVTQVRADKTAQARSCLVGRKTGIFNKSSSLTASERARVDEVRSNLNESEIASTIAELERWEARFIHPYTGRGVDVSYEDLVGEYRITRLDAIYDLIQPKNRIYEPKTVKISR